MFGSKLAILILIGFAFLIWWFVVAIPSDLDEPMSVIHCANCGLNVGDTVGVEVYDARKNRIITEQWCRRSCYRGSLD